MSDGHERFEALALGHALGGLDAAEASDLREHLRGCGDCRARVAELRDLAHDLDVAARDERRRGAASRRRHPSAVELDVDVDAAPEAPAGPVAGRRRRLLVALLAAASLPLAFWNLHLRSASATYFAAAEERGATIELLAGPDSVGVEGPGALSGRVAVDAARLAVVLLDVGPLDSDERLVAWLSGTSDDVEHRVLAVGPSTEVAVATVLERGGAVRLRVTRERGLLGSAPTGAPLVDVDLAALTEGQARSSGSSSK